MPRIGVVSSFLFLDEGGDPHELVRQHGHAGQYLEPVFSFRRAALHCSATEQYRNRAFDACPEALAFFEAGAFLERFTFGSFLATALGECTPDRCRPDLSKLNLYINDGRRGVWRRVLRRGAGVGQTGAKTVLGFHQGATENQQICDQLLEGLCSRRLNLNHHGCHRWRPRHSGINPEAFW